MSWVLRFATALCIVPALVGPAAAADPIEGRWDLHVYSIVPGMVQSVRGTLVLGRGSRGWGGACTLQGLMTEGRGRLRELKVRDGAVAFVVPALGYRFEGTIKDGRLGGACGFGGDLRGSWSATRAERTKSANLFDKEVPEEGFLPRATPKSVGLDEEALWRLIWEAAETDTDALIVLKDGKVVCERTFGKKQERFQIMAMTSFVTAFAVGLLVEDGVIDSLDLPVSRWYPEWEEEDCGKVTLRHLVTHTSGIPRGASGPSLFEAKDMVRHVLDMQAREPGTAWSYSDEGVALLSGIIAKAAGMPCDEFLRKRIFDPLGIKDAVWVRDEAGNTDTCLGLGLSARSLALIGNLVAEKGTVARKKVIAEKTLGLLSGQGTPLNPQVGLLWFRILEDKACVGVRYDAWPSQHIAIYSAERLVGVRLRRADKANRPQFNFREFTSALGGCLRFD